MVLLKKRALFSAIMLIAAFAMASTPVIAQEQSAPPLSGTVIDASTQQALSGVEVEIEGLDQSATTDSEGNFSFENIEPGAYTVTIEADGYEEWEKEVAVTQEEKTLNIKLKPSEGG
jgi:iron complex outermembrane receptor protein